MSQRLFCLIFIAIAFISCTDEEKRAALQAKEEKKKEQVFASINEHWKFETSPTNASSQALLATWDEWRILLSEMAQKPQSSIGAFKKKAKVLSEKMQSIPRNIPPAYNKPQIKARIAVLTTKINELNLYVNLNEIPAQKVNTLVAEINAELRGFQAQLDEIDRKARIPKEQGEADMIRMLDTARAIPTSRQGSFLPEEAQPKPQTPARNSPFLKHQNAPAREQKLPSN